MVADRRTASLRVRLTATAVVVLGCGLLAGCVVLLVVLQHVLVAAVDSGARQRARDVAELVVEDRLPDPVPVADTSASVQVLDGEGHVLASSVGGDRLVPLVPPSQLPRLRGGEVVRIDAVRLGSTGSLRVVGRASDTLDGRRTVVVAVPSAGSGSVRTVGLAFVLAVPLLLLAVGGMSWRLVGSAMRPVEQLRAGAADITATRTARRLPVPESADELRRLAETLNAMLDRLATSEARTRAFVADAAHELRSPLATLRLHVELGAPDDAVSREDLIDDVDRLARLVDDLLLLARADAGATTGRREDADLSQLAETVVARQAWRVPVRVDATPTHVTADADAVARALGNVLDNAVRHASTAVVLEVTQDGGMAVLRVTDDGPGIPLAQRERVLERFVRLDSARARDAGGSGLGLAIVTEIVRAHGGGIRLDDAAPGLRVTLSLPVSGEAPRPA